MQWHRAGRVVYLRQLAISRRYRYSSKALLRQPGGFEGFAALSEVLHLGDLPVAKRDHAEDTLVEGHTAPLAANVGGAGDQHAPLARLENILDRYPPVLDGFHQLIECASNALRSAITLVCGTKRGFQTTPG